MDRKQGNRPMNANPALVGLVVASTVVTLAFAAAAPGFSATLASVLEAPGMPLEEPETASDPTSEPHWETANWWIYNVTLRDQDPRLVAVVVHDVDDQGIHVGTNQSNGFMGLPIGGTFTHELNPTFAGETWRMYDFPLHDGKAWDQPLLGYTLNTSVEAAMLDPAYEANSTAGYALEASAYGRTIATYTYHPDAAWFTELSIQDPQKGERVFHAELVDHGPAWDQAYFVTETVHQTTTEYPSDLPGDESFEVPSGYEEVRVHLRATVSAGVISASVHDTDAEAASVRVLGHGFDIETARVEEPEGDWRLTHRGTGQGETMLEVLGVQAITPEQATQETDDGPVPIETPPGTLDPAIEDAPLSLGGG